MGFVSFPINRFEPGRFKGRMAHELNSPAAATPPGETSSGASASAGRPVRRIRRLLSLTAIGQGADVGFSSLATLLIVTTISPSEWAYYNLTLGALHIAQRASSLGLDTAAVRALSRANRDDDVRTQHAVLQAAFLAKLAVSAMMLAIGWITAPLVAEVWLERSGVLPYLRLAYLGLFGQQLIGLYKSWFAARLQFGRHALVVAAAPALIFAGLIVASSLGVLNLKLCTAIVVLTPVVVTCLLTLLLAPRLIERFHGFEELRRMWRFSRWTYLTEVLGTVRWELGSFVLLALMSSTSAGLYGIANKAAGKISLVANSLFTVLMPWAAHLRTRDELHGYLKASYRWLLLLLLGIPMSLLAAWAGRPLIRLLNPEFEPAIALFVVLFVSMLLTIAALPTRTVLYAVHRPEIETFIEVLSLLLTIAFYWLLIPRHGAMGACVAMALQRGASALMTILYVRHKVRSNDLLWFRLEGPLEVDTPPRDLQDLGWRAVERPLPTSAQIARRLIGYGPGKSLQYAYHRLSEQFNEWRFSIETERRVDALSAFGVTNADYKGYSPIAFRAFRAVLRHVEVRPDRDVLLDIGSGKGRAVVLAATYPFKRIIGVDIAEELNVVARSNIARARRHLRCARIEIVTADAVTFDIPDDVTIVHAFDPFQGPGIEALIESIRRSVRRAPRRLTVLYANPHRFEALASGHAWLRRRLDVRYPFAELDVPDFHRYRIYDVDLERLDDGTTR